MPDLKTCRSRSKPKAEIPKTKAIGYHCEAEIPKTRLAATTAKPTEPTGMDWVPSLR